MTASIGNAAGWIISGTLFAGLCVWAVLDARKHKDA